MTKAEGIVSVMAPDSPADIWSACALAEEIPLPEPSFFGRLRDAKAISTYLPQIESALHQLPEKTVAAYREWSCDAATYRFASEAFYQFRLMECLVNANRANRLLPDSPLYLARQLILPSAFAGTPRIKHVGNAAFVIYPQAAVYWLYEFMTLLVCEVDSIPTRDDTIVEFLYRTLARVAFAKAASPATAYGIDFLLDEIVLNGKLGAEAHPIVDQSVALVRGVEDLIVNHELAHSFLGHGESAGPEVEAEADRYAIELMLFSMSGEWNAGEEEKAFHASTLPFEAYIALHVWGLIRNVADRRIRVFTVGDDAELALERSKNDAAHAVRMTRLSALGSLFRFPVPPKCRELLASGLRLVERVSKAALDQSEIERIVRLSRSLAVRDYSVLRREILESVEGFKNINY